MMDLVTELVRIAAFSDGPQGGNPAGVWTGASLPGAEEMQRIAAEVGFSETAFAAPLQPGESVSYTHLRAHETDSYLVCRLLLEKKRGCCEDRIARW